MGPAPSHHRPGGGFQNPWPHAALHGAGGMLRWTGERMRHPRRPDPDPSMFRRAAPAFVTPRAQPGQLTVTWAGHATALIQLGQTNILTDPHWGERASPVTWAGPRRRIAPGIAFDTLPPLDLVVLSHNHYDHLDAGTVRRLARRAPDTPWYVPLGLAAFVHGLGVRHVEELDWWDDRALTTAAGATLRVTCVPAQHFSARTPFDRDATLWCGWVVGEEPAGHRLYFAGDSGYCPAFADIGRRLSPFDVALVPIGAYDPRWFMQPVHMNPEEAVRAFRDVAVNSPRAVMVPIHWGTFKLTDEPLDEPPRRLEEAWRAAGLPEERLWLLAHGETRSG